MKKSGKLGAVVLFVLLVLCWVIICKPFSNSEEDYNYSESNVTDNNIVTVISNDDSNSTQEVVVDDSISENESDGESDLVIEQSQEQEEINVTETTEVEETEEIQTVYYRFRNKKLLNQHYEKHGIEMGFASAEDYEAAASAVINNPDALNKIEAEDGDYVYYVESSNEFVILSTDGYIRTYFNPNAGLAYYNRQ